MKTVIKNGVFYECCIDGIVLENGEEASIEATDIIYKEVENLYPSFFYDMQKQIINQYFRLNIFG